MLQAIGLGGSRTESAPDAKAACRADGRAELDPIVVARALPLCRARLVGASARTLRHWRSREAELPLSLLACFRAPGRTWRSVVVRALAFIGPLTTARPPSAHGF